MHTCELAGLDSGAEYASRRAGGRVTKRRIPTAVKRPVPLVQLIISGTTDMKLRLRELSGIQLSGMKTSFSPLQQAAMPAALRACPAPYSSVGARCRDRGLAGEWCA